MPKFSDDWQVVLRHAWSIRWLAVAFVSGTVEATLQFVDASHSFGFGLLIAVTGSFASVAGIVSRVLAQKELAKDA